VHDCGPDDSARVIRELQARHDVVRGLWLSRNFGQHAATLAGMASTASEWIVTMDEDGQHDPAQIGVLLDAALDHGSALVYAAPTNEAPHGGVRNAASRTAKRLVERLVGTSGATQFHSFRLVLGEVGRSLAAYAGAGVYLDVALGWIAGRAVTAPVTLRDEGERRSGYRLRTLMSHFWRMVITGGTRPLRMVSVLGVVFALIGLAVAVVLSIARLGGAEVIQGWTSLIVLVLVSTGAVLFSLGVIAEYVGAAVHMAMGKPLYLLVSDPAEGPLARTRRRRTDSRAQR
jgi:glycosyltransferase involved in cell wall biosynthesis